MVLGEMTAGNVIDGAAAIEWARSLATRPGRTMLGITGPPGGGKSTLAVAVCSALGAQAALVPMDGFHLADRVLDSLGLRDRKGAPETFDSAGYAALLGRLRRGDEPVVYVPEFERELEQPLAGAIAVPRSVRLVVTEGNYLLCQGEAWPQARGHLDEVWYCEVADDVRLARLTERHIRFGKTAEHAQRWIESVDGPNARLIAATRQFADRIVAID